MFKKVKKTARDVKRDRRNDKEKCGYVTIVPVTSITLDECIAYIDELYRPAYEGV